MPEIHSVPSLRIEKKKVARVVVVHNQLKVSWPTTHTDEQGIISSEILSF